MNEFVKQNKRLLEIYCVAARIFGWLLIVAGIVQLGIKWSILASHKGLNVGEISSFILIYLLQFVYSGLLLLGIRQFIRHLLQVDCKHGLILRFGTKILYSYAVLFVMGQVSHHLYMIPNMMDNMPNFSILSYIWPQVIFVSVANDSRT